CAGFAVSAEVSAVAPATPAPAPARKPRRGILAIAGSSLCPLQGSLGGTLVRITRQEQAFTAAKDEEPAAATRSRNDSPPPPARSPRWAAPAGHNPATAGRIHRRPGRAPCRHSRH